jgi:hypothetical protein
MSALEHSLKKWKSFNLWGHNKNDIHQCTYLKDGCISEDFCKNVCMISDCDHANGFENRKSGLKAKATRSRLARVVSKVILEEVENIPKTCNLKSVLRQEQEIKILLALDYGMASTVDIANFIYPGEDVGVGSPIYVDMEDTLRQMNHKGLVKRLDKTNWQKIRNL